MIEKLRALNEMLIVTSEDDLEELRKQKLIKKLLDDEKCFFKMDIESAYSLLRDLTIAEEDVEDVYCELIDIRNS